MTLFFSPDKREKDRDIALRWESREAVVEALGTPFKLVITNGGIGRVFLSEFRHNNSD